jgi:hypothetical protein
MRLHESPRHPSHDCDRRVHQAAAEHDRFE